MKKFYAIFFVSFIALSGLLYISTWWFLGGVSIIIIITTYHFYNTRLKTFAATIEDLESQVEILQRQLDRSLLREDKATSEARQIRQTKQNLLTTLNHEIRTPMNGVLGTSLLLESTILTNEQKGYVDIIRNSGQSLLGTVNEILVNDILDYSKLERRDKKLQVIDFNLRDTVEEVANMFANKTAIDGIELLIDIDDNVPLQLHGDNKRLREIMMNLLENAVKFTQRGHILVHVQSLNKNNDQPVITFNIEDTGCGIDNEQKKKLFYVAPSRDFDNRKQGRGLIICHKHIELMGGIIDVKSNPGSGSVFTFTLPFINGKALTPHNNLGGDNWKIFEAKRILVIDDNSTSRNIIIKQLKAWKMLAAGTASGIQALELLEHDTGFDVVLVDLDMPQMDGFQFARAIKKLYPDLQLGLLNPTGFESFRQEQELFSIILTKPLRQHVFRDTLLALFARSVNEEKSAPQKMENAFSKKYPLKILIAEDNYVNQKIAIKILTKLGYQPGLANNGREALEMSGEYDVVLMDVQMPEMDGLEATRMIRSKQVHQPIILAMTANVLQGDRDACLQAGMDDYISKPIVIDELTNKLEKWFAVINENIP
jgi:signal transduction histidine kinase/CheY-like chemotaxis protein